MNPRDLSNVPTLSGLNKPQKRALILRDQLRYLEPAHLDIFLNGVTADEPPTYQHFNSATYPPLAQVTIKEEATSFDLGNLQSLAVSGRRCKDIQSLFDGVRRYKSCPIPKEEQADCRWHGWTSGTFMKSLYLFLFVFCTQGGRGACCLRPSRA